MFVCVDSAHCVGPVYNDGKDKETSDQTHFPTHCLSTGLHHDTLTLCSGGCSNASPYIMYMIP